MRSRRSSAVLAFSLATALCACSYGHIHAKPRDAGQSHDAGRRVDLLQVMNASSEHEGDLPATTDMDVKPVPPLPQTAPPGTTITILIGLPPSSDGSEPEAILVKIDGSGTYLEVPIDEAMRAAGQVRVVLHLDDHACDGRCEGSVRTSVGYALRLSDGRVGAVVTTDVLLDCGNTGTTTDCQKAPDAGPSCTSCGDDGVCTDLQADRQNCGTCGTACSGKQPCVLGRCTACPADLDPCICDSCADLVSRCLSEPGCADVIACARDQGCSGADCLSNAVCGPLIQTYQKTTRGSAIALQLAQCSNACN
jgi:hypothetical protein